MSEANWYVVHTYSGYENKVKVDIEKTIENRKLQDQILEVSVPMQDVIELKNGAQKQVAKKMFPGYVLINMVMNDDTWYVVRNTRALGFREAGLVVEFEEGDTVVVTAGAWKDTVGVIKSINEGKQTLTINVEMFGRETPVELNFTEVKKM